MNAKLIFSYNDSSLAEYSSPPINDVLYEHKMKLFHNVEFHSQYFTQYTELSDKKFTFPFPTYGTLSKFWESQKNPKDSSFNDLKMKWIYQLTQGLKELHEHQQYYGNLSSKCITIDDDLNVKYTFFISDLKSFSDKKRHLK